ncbi:MAG: methylated-DNA--[protein]-cysteine S-methyltransferase [Myxococcota bacterium]
MTLRHDTVETPLGPFSVLVDGDGRLHAAGFEPVDALARRIRAASEAAEDPGLASAVRRYFAGDPRAIDGLPVVVGGTPFQNAVWLALAEIPCGETRSYGEIAQRIGQPKAVRAVGRANGSNPIALVLPCHRVIGADGSLTGYGGGLPRKRWLLAHEQPGLFPSGRSQAV